MEASTDDHRTESGGTSVGYPDLLLCGCVAGDEDMRQGLKDNELLEHCDSGETTVPGILGSKLGAMFSMH